MKCLEYHIWKQMGIKATAQGWACSNLMYRATPSTLSLVQGRQTDWDHTWIYGQKETEIKCLFTQSIHESNDSSCAHLLWRQTQIEYSAPPGDSSEIRDLDNTKHEHQNHWDLENGIQTVSLSYICSYNIQFLAVPGSARLSNLLWLQSQNWMFHQWWVLCQKWETREIDELAAFSTIHSGSDWHSRTGKYLLIVIDVHGAPTMCWAHRAGYLDEPRYLLVPTLWSYIRKQTKPPHVQIESDTMTS